MLFYTNRCIYNNTKRTSMKITFTSMLLLFTLFSFSQNCSDCRYADSLELVKLYNATDGANWTNKWDLTQPMETWYSAIPVFENGRVTYIDLQQNGLNGTIPNLNLPKLKELFLSDYNLTGSLPNFSLPALEILFITNSQVSGTLPDFNLPNLQSLAVSGCPFITGTIPAFNNMPNLRQLALSGNQLSGTIPNFTQSLTSLQLGGNQLSGTIPDFSMPNLTTLELDGNQLTGSIPNLNLPKLQYLSVGGNQLTGAIPELHLPALLSLNAAYNQLSGSLPSFNYLPLLNVLTLSNNQLSGAAPNFGSKPPLYTIDLSYNQLTGSTPAYNLPLLVNLFLGNNQLTGTIPSFQLPKLQGLSLRHNQLSGAIPDFDLPELTALVLDSNQLTGSIPNFNLPQLQFLHLNSNQLSGSIPPFNLPYLQSLLLNDNQLTGCIPGDIKTNSPSLQHEGDISNNPGLATQSWTDYWDNNAGVCQPPPTSAVLTADASSICSGSSTALRVAITGGNSPYTVVYLAFHTRDTVTNYISGSDIPVSPANTTSYSLVSVTDATSNTGTGNSGTPIITVTQPTTWYLDADRDKYYISSVLSCINPGPGYSDRGSPAPGDCNDNNAAVHPNATEICDGIDNNCDGQVDEGFPFITYYRDADGDGYGTPDLFIGVKCIVPDGYVTNNQDCNDNNAAVHPGAAEICGNGIDDNCNGQVDEGCTVTVRIAIADKAKNEGNGQNTMPFALTLNKKATQTVQVAYATQNGTAIAGSDYVAQTGTITFAPGVKRQTINIIIKGDRRIEPDETFKVVLSNPVNAVFADGTAVGTIINDDGAAAAFSSQLITEATPANADRTVTVSPNPAQGKVYVTLKGYTGNVTIQVQSVDGKILRAEKLQVASMKSAQQLLNVSGLANGIYFIRVMDEKGSPQTEKLVIQH